jgi:uncharacterized protein
VIAKIVACAALLLFLLPNMAQAQGFPCHGNLAPDEETICDDPQLGRLDEQLNGVYQSALRSAPPHGQQQIRDAQPNWLRSRRACGRDRACIRDLYVDQIRWLRQFI